MISTAAMIPFRAKAVKKVLVEAVVAPLRSDLGGGDERSHKKKKKKARTKKTAIHSGLSLWWEKEEKRWAGNAMRSGST